MAADELEPVEAGAVVMAMSASEYSSGFWDIRGNVFAAGLALFGLVYGTLVAAVLGEFWVISAIPYNLGLVGAIWLSISWIKRKRAGW